MLKKLDESSFLIFSIFTSLVGFGVGPTYILYQFISSFRGEPYIISFSLQQLSVGVFIFGGEI